jgi:hypothetical protein
VLQPSEVDALKEGVLNAFQGPEDGYGPTIRTLMFEKGEPT